MATRKAAKPAARAGKTTRGKAHAATAAPAMAESANGAAATEPTAVVVAPRDGSSLRTQKAVITEGRSRRFARNRVVAVTQTAAATSAHDVLPVPVQAPLVAAPEPIVAAGDAFDEPEPTPPPAEDWTQEEPEEVVAEAEPELAEADAAELADPVEDELAVDAEDLTDDLDAESDVEPSSPSSAEPADLAEPEPTVDETATAEPAPRENKSAPAPVDDDPFVVRMDEDAGITTQAVHATGSPSASVAVAKDESMQEAPAPSGPVAARANLPLGMEMPNPAEATGLTLPTQFLLVAWQEGWDDRMLKPRAGSQGAAIVGSMLLELALRGALRVQRTSFVVGEDPTGDARLDQLARDVRAMGDRSTISVIERLTKGLAERLDPWIDDLEARGIVRARRWRHLGVFPRSELVVTDEDAKAKLENRLVRVLAGGGNPDSRTIALLGLIDAAGLLPELVPSSALAFNRKRLQGLLTGRDILHYRVDHGIKKVQDLCLTTILDNVKAIQGVA